MNLYEYVRSNPINYNDPLGLLIPMDESPSGVPEPKLPQFPSRDKHRERNRDNFVPCKRPTKTEDGTFRDGYGKPWEQDIGNPFHGGYQPWRDEEGNEATYDKDGNLINGGYEQGTFNFSPYTPGKGDWLDFIYHVWEDVFPDRIYGSDYEPTPQENTY